MINVPNGLEVFFIERDPLLPLPRYYKFLHTATAYELYNRTATFTFSHQWFFFGKEYLRAILGVCIEEEWIITTLTFNGHSCPPLTAAANFDTWFDTYCIDWLVAGDYLSSPPELTPFYYASENEMCIQFSNWNACLNLCELEPRHDYPTTALW